MIQSMTGYGKSEKQTESGTLSVEIRAVNNRFLDLSIRMPESLDSYEEELKRLINEPLMRGRVKVNITLNGNGKSSDHLKINSELFGKYYQALSAAAREIGLRDKVKLQHLLALPDLISVKTPRIDEEELLATIREVLVVAVQELCEMRATEGLALAAEIAGHLDLIEEKLAAVEELAENLKNNYFEKSKQRLKLICEDLNFDENRILQEAAIMAKKADITEECERLKSHIKQFRSFLRQEQPIGKKMTFILQEMNREVTTIGSKSEDFAVSHHVVDIKDELEKLREQAQNIL